MQNCLHNIITQLGLPALDPATTKRLLQYATLVAQWDATHDLTAARSTEQLAEILFVDALVLANSTGTPPREGSLRQRASRPQPLVGVTDAIVAYGSRIVDVGAGSGAPSLPLALIREDISVCLVEPRKKRAAFLRWAVGTLDNTDASPRVGSFRQRASGPHPLGDATESVVGALLAAPLRERITVIEARVDPKKPAVANMPFDIALSRATFAPVDWLPIGQQLASRVVVLTTPSEADTAVGAPLLAQHVYEWPLSHAPRTLRVYNRCTA